MTIKRLSLIIIIFILGILVGAIGVKKSKNFIYDLDKNKALRQAYFQEFKIDLVQGFIRDQDSDQWVIDIINTGEVNIEINEVLFEGTIFKPKYQTSIPPRTSENPYA